MTKGVEKALHRRCCEGSLGFSNGRWEVLGCCVGRRGRVSIVYKYWKKIIKDPRKREQQPLWL